jgi:hypothetical protein
LSRPYPLHFSNGTGALAREIADRDELAAALIDFGPPRPVLVLVGGADSLSPETAQLVSPWFKDRLIPLLERIGAALIDGGTDSGIMSLIGRARAHAGASFPLIGIAARGTVRMPSDAVQPCHRGTTLEPNHTHFLLVPGNRWGDESPWIGAAAQALAADAPSVTLAAGGGEITGLDLELSLQAGRHTLLLAGSGGITDDLSRALRRNDLEMLNIEGEQAGLLQTADISNAGAILGKLLSGAPALGT